MLRGNPIRARHEPVGGQRDDDGDQWVVLDRPSTKPPRACKMALAGAESGMKAHSSNRAVAQAAQEDS